MYDKTPLEGGANYGSSGFKLREIILGIVSVVALVACFIFLGLYAHGRSTSGNPIGNPITQPMVASTTPKPTQKTCDTATCLETTAYVRSLMNVTINPCEDFYSYACGQWPSQNPLRPNHYYNNVRDKLSHANKEKVRSLLDSTKLRDVPWGAESKAKDLYQSCLDDYGRGVASGKTFIDKVIKQTGDWYVLNDGFDPDSWNFLSVIEEVHVDFWTDVFFKVYVRVDWQNRGQRVITLQSGGLGMRSYNYLGRYSYYNKTRNDYMAYMRKVGWLLTRDYGLDMDDDDNARLDTYVSDVMRVETMLASLSRYSIYPWRRFRQNRRVQIKDINRLTGNMFDWVSFFGYMFDKPKVNGNTWIVIPQQQYLSRIASGINGLGQNKSRMLNNYFVWQMALTYVNDLSSEYIHAARQYRNDQYGVTEFPSTWEYCFGYVSTKMDEAMSHLFVQDHFADDNKRKVHEIADYVKRALMNSITNMKFMDDSTRRYAKDKVKALIDKLGYPDYISNTDEIDVIYSSLEVHPKDYFQNVLNMNKFNKADLNNYLNENLLDRDRWTINAYWTFISVRQALNQLTIPAGMLQFPVYDYSLPHYINFGSMGSLVANAYVQTIGTIGSRYGKTGTRYQGTYGNLTRWWTNYTIQNYQTGHDCMSNFYINKTLGTYVIPWSRSQATYTATVNKARALAYGDYAATEVGGVKQAYNAYKLWQQDNGPEQTSPIVGLSNDQMFFIAYAQTRCFVWSDITRYLRYRYGRLPDSMGVNGAVAQMPEFSQAFKCSKDASLNPPDKCIVF